jgi:hypothetical protein
MDNLGELSIVSKAALKAMYFGNVVPHSDGRRGRATRHARRSPSMMPDATTSPPPFLPVCSGLETFWEV